MKKILLLCLAINYLECAPNHGSVVETPNGPVRGVQNEKGDFTMYLGVPYGVVDEDNPFGDAKPPPKFTSVYEAVAIIQSGVALTPWIFAKNTNLAPVMVANELGFKGDDVIGALDYLKGFNAADVINVTHSLKIDESETTHPLTRPCVESESDGAILTDYPVNLKPKVKDLDIMIGHTFREASFRYPVSDESYYENYVFDIELEQDFNEILDEKHVRNFYIKDEKTSLNVRPQILDFASDFAFAHPTARTVDRYLEAGVRNVYRYLFTYQGDRNGMSKNTTDGTNHGDDMGYLWNENNLPEEPNAADQKMIDIMTKLYTDFAKYGNPTPSGPTDLIPVKWEPTVGEQRPYLLIDEPLSLEHRLFNERMVFWDMYYKLHADKVKGRGT
ncbi:unnamed protein product [Arctia plantaginis]|uniref:Carboxylesterase type B domain-containing protein n=1 Tax=Arctia plantaginis TaxID=874455 RepID=A0A8S1BHL9_ARCPL|nr:unnamed protein product [Arctia plantaginis]